MCVSRKYYNPKHIYYYVYIIYNVIYITYIYINQKKAKKKLKTTTNDLEGIRSRTIVVGDYTALSSLHRSTRLKLIYIYILYYIYS